MSGRILFVDDEPNVLSGIRRTLRNRFDISTADGGQEALKLFDEGAEFSVIVSDMRMPNMNGVELLAAVKERSPQTVRLMLTGNSDQQTAIDAVNKGDIFRFLNKPCPAENLVNSIQASLEQHRLITAEQELLEKTLRGSVEALAQVLALVNPSIFGRTDRIKHYVREIALQLGQDDPWRYETMALLAQIGCVAVQSDVLEKAGRGDRLEADEATQYASHPAVAADLLLRIPRLEGIAEAIRFQQLRYDGANTPPGNPTGEQLPLGARLLKAVLDFEQHEGNGIEAIDAMQKLRNDAAAYDPSVIEAFEAIVSTESALDVVVLKVTQLTIGMLLAADVVTVKGALVVCKGLEISESVRARLQNFFRNELIAEKVHVWAPAGSESVADKASA